MYSKLSDLGLLQLVYRTIDGDYIEFSDGGLFEVQDITGLFMPPVRFVDETYKQGSVIRDVGFEQRQIQVFFQATVESRAAFWDLRKRLINVMRPNRRFLRSQGSGRLELTLSNGDIRYLNVILANAGEFSINNGSWDMFCLEEELRFVTTGSPFFYDPDPFVITQAFTGVGIQCKTFDIDYCGDVECFPTINFEGEYTELSIRSISTGESIAIESPVPLTNAQILLEPESQLILDGSGTNITGLAQDFGSLSCFGIADHPKAFNGKNTWEVCWTPAPVSNGNGKLQIKYNACYLGS